MTYEKIRPTDQPCNACGTTESPRWEVREEVPPIANQGGGTMWLLPRMRRLCETCLMELQL